MAELRIANASELDPELLEPFLRRVYGLAKGDFLSRHGAWWHRGNHNRWAVLQQDKVAAYCAIIPTRCRIEGSPRPALWWVDLVVLPEYRGLGLQRVLDQELRRRADLKLGFPNRLAARIHRRHGWGVREDFRILLLPLDPGRVRMVRAAHGVRGALIKSGAAALKPAALWLRKRLAGYQPRSTRALADPSAAALADIFHRRHQRAWVTCWRDAEFLQWRYLDAPYRAELRFYVAGASAEPSLALISRTLDLAGVKIVRVLDLFGDLDDRARLRDILCTCARDAAREEAIQVTILATLPRLRTSLRSIGFVIGAKARFCWHSSSPELMALLGRQPWSLNLGDSDNDDPTE